MADNKFYKNPIWVAGATAAVGVCAFVTSLSVRPTETQLSGQLVPSGGKWTIHGCISKPFQSKDDDLHAGDQVTMWVNEAAGTGTKDTPIRWTVYLVLMGFGFLCLLIAGIIIGISVWKQTKSKQTDATKPTTPPPPP